MQDVIGADMRVHIAQSQQRRRHEAAVAQHDDAVGKLAHDVHLVFDQHDDLFGIALELAYQVKHDWHFVHAHAGGGFVEHEAHRIQRHQHGDL